MRDVRDDIEPGHALLFEERDREGVALCEQSHDDVRARDLFLAARLHVGGGAADGPVNAERRRRADREVVERLDLLGQERVELLLEHLRIPARVTDDVRGRLVEQQGVEQVLDREVLVVPRRAAPSIRWPPPAIYDLGRILIVHESFFGRSVSVSQGSAWAADTSARRSSGGACLARFSAGSYRHRRASARRIADASSRRSPLPFAVRCARRAVAFHVLALVEKTAEHFDLRIPSSCSRRCGKSRLKRLGTLRSSGAPRRRRLPRSPGIRAG